MIPQFRPVLLASLLSLSLAAAPLLAAPPAAAAPIRVVIVGLVHGHVSGFLQALPNNPNATLVAIVEPDTALAQQLRLPATT